MSYLLKDDGDPHERRAWFRYLKNEFPSYEPFWQTHVVPLTNRPIDGHFKSDSELPRGKGPQDICIAQLCYTTLRHLLRCHELKSKCKNIDAFIEAMMRLSAALDCAFELFERLGNSGYDPWDEIKGKQAREKCRKHLRADYKEKIDPVRYYRNHLVHGRLCLVIEGNIVPKLGVEQKYLDWRKVTQGVSATVKQDFVTMTEVLQQGWQRVITYLECEFKRNCSVPQKPRQINLVQPKQLSRVSTISPSASGSWDSQERRK